MRSELLLPFLLVFASSSVRSAAAEPADGKLKVVTTLNVLADFAREVGGDHVEVQALEDPREDPHYVQPRPTLMRRAREADVFVESGLQLELWATRVIQGSGNPKIQSGAPGYVVASLGIPTLELPAQLSREWGDIHPFGNPHIWLDPINAKDMAENIAKGLEKVDPANQDDYEKNLKDFQHRIDVALFGEDLVKEVGGRMLSRQARSGRLDDWLKSRGLSERLGGWLKLARPLQGRPVVTYHKTWIYFATRFGLTIPIEIEEKPGIPPSARHRDDVVALMEKQGVKTVLEAIFYDRGAADYLSSKTGAHVVAVPIDTGEDVGIASYTDLMDKILHGVLRSEGAE